MGFVGFDSSDRKPRIIVCGLGRVGLRILSLLKHQGAYVVGIHDREIAGESIEIIVGELQAASTLLAAGIREAQTLVLCCSDEALNLSILMQARVLNPRVRIINRLFNTSLGERLDRTLTDHVSMSVAALAAPVFAFTALGKKAIGQVHLFNQTWPIHEEYIDEEHPWYGKKLSDLWDDRASMFIYYLPAHDRVDLISAALAGRTLELGDRLLVGTRPNKRSARQTLSQSFSKLLTRLRQFFLDSRSVLTVALTLATTILIATIAYTAFQRNISIVDALYFSVGMITGAGGNDFVVEKASAIVKIFTVVMMLLGTAIIGIWYALLTDFILGARFHQFWNAAPIPRREHYIICGLGGIGVQVAMQLHSYGHEVVVIERDPQNRFLSTAKAAGIPLISGDASLPNTLRSAYLDRAAGLLVVTSDDRANLEIALTAKGLAPRVNAIVRHEEPHLAKIAQQVFEFESVLSPPEIVAPAFAAAALGGKILGNGITADSLWVALATIVTPNHPFCGKLVKDVAMAVDLVPLYIETASKRTIHGWDLLSAHLDPGDVLYLTIPATKLEQIWRVTPYSISNY